MTVHEYWSYCIHYIRFLFSISSMYGNNQGFELNAIVNFLSFLVLCNRNSLKIYFLPPQIRQQFCILRILKSARLIFKIISHGLVHKDYMRSHCGLAMLHTRIQVDCVVGRVSRKTNSYTTLELITANNNRVSMRFYSVVIKTNKTFFVHRAFHAEIFDGSNTRTNCSSTYRSSATAVRVVIELLLLQRLHTLLLLLLLL